MINPRKQAQRIIELVSSITGVPVERMKTRTRKEAVVMARSYAVYRIYADVYSRHKDRITLADIGRMFYIGFDHSMVIAANRRMSDWITHGYADVMALDGRYCDAIEVCAMVTEKAQCELQRLIKELKDK